MVFEKIALNKVLSVAFDLPIKVTYWDGKVEEYGDGPAQAEIIFNKKFAFTRH